MAYGASTGKTEKDMITELLQEIEDEEAEEAEDRGTDGIQI